jgi:DNA-binding MarR family transcriptional regulator
MERCRQSERSVKDASQIDGIMFIIRAMDGPLPLPTLLSHTLVAFTIEFDNEFEHQLPHRTTHRGTKHGSGSDSRDAPWLVSLVMWSNYMRFVGEDGVRVREFQTLARLTKKDTENWLARLGRWWGYVVVAPDPADVRANPPYSDWVVRPTRAGRQAQEIWHRLFGDIEERWQTRFGKDEIGKLRESLWVLTEALSQHMDVELLDYLPILGHGLFSKGPDSALRARTRDEDDTTDCDLPLSALLSRVLLAFAIEFEREAELSLAICANFLRVLDEQGVRVRDLPLLTGVSKEATSIAIGILQKRREAVIEPDQSGSRSKVARLTLKGREAQKGYRRLLVNLEDRWHARLGEDAIRKLRAPLEQLVGEPTKERSPLFRGLEPYPDGWRAFVPQPNILPHYPMVLHRGGFPDGS